MLGCLNKIVAVRVTIFDNKEQIKNFALHALQGIVLVLKSINKLNVSFFQETIELNFHFIVNLYNFLLLLINF